MRSPIQSFRGMNNVVDPLDLGLGWQKVADDINIDNAGRIQRRDGYSQSVVQTSNTGAYNTKDLQRAYVVDSGILKRVNSDLTLTTLETGLASTRMYFDEINGHVFGSNGTDFLTISPADSVKTWGVPAPATPSVALSTGILPAGTYRVCSTLVDPDGLEGSNSDVAVLELSGDQQIQISVTAVAGYTQNVYVTAANGTVFFLLDEEVSTLAYNVLPVSLGRELRFWFTDVPRGTRPCFFGGRCYLAEYFPDQDQSAVWFSAPLAFHHFDVGKDAVMVPGRVTMLKASAQLIIGTERAAHAWDGTNLTTLCNYGVVEGYHDALHEGKLYFWTDRGLCRALPFENLTERQVSVAPGTFCGATVIESRGNIRYVVALQSGGSAYNATPAPTATVNQSFLLMSGQGGYLLTHDGLRIRIT